MTTTYPTLKRLTHRKTRVAKTEYTIKGRKAHVEKSGSYWEGWFDDDHGSGYLATTKKAVLFHMGYYDDKPLPRYRIRRTPTTVLIGDCKEAKRSYYEKPISIEEAQAMTDMLCNEMGWPKITCRMGRKTSKRYGTMKNINRLGLPIIMNLNKPSEGVVIHELGHMANYDHRRSCGHSSLFKQTQRALIKLRYGTASQAQVA